MKIATAHLDPETRDYLAEVDRDRGEGHDGVYIRNSFSRPDPRQGWGKLVFSGFLVAIVAAVLSLPYFLESLKIPTASLVQSGLIGLGVLLFLFGIRRRARTLPPEPFNGFYFADGQYFWKSTLGCVEAMNLEQLVAVDGCHISHGDFYVMSRITLRFPTANEEFYVFNREEAEAMIRFLEIGHWIRQADDANVRRLAAEPARLGQVARQLLKGESADLSAELSSRRSLSHPCEVESESLAPKSRGQVVSWVAASVVGLLGFLVLPSLNRVIVDEHQYEIAIRESDSKRSPAPLRRYLANKDNQRHRDEAQKCVDRYYDEAIALLKSRAAKESTKLDTEMFEAVIALLEGMKSNPSSVATIGFTATIEREPTTEAKKMLEKAIYDLRLAGDRDLQNIGRSRGNAILGHGRVFDAEQVEMREALIIDRLNAALQQVLNADLIQFVPAAPGEKPMFEVAYHTAPSGTLYRYTSTVKNKHSTSTTVEGLLRGYDVNWTITIRPPGAAKEFVCKLESQPENQLKLDGRSGDPDWAPYAVILYSGFYDMSNRLITNFGAKPPPVQTEFTFAMATGAKK